MKEEKNEEIALLTSPPSLPPSLITEYNSLSDVEKLRFTKMFNYLWGVVAPAVKFTRFGGVLHAFWAVEFLRAHTSLTSRDLAILTYIYQETDKGTKYIKAKIFYDKAELLNTKPISMRSRFTALKRSGWIVRRSSDPRRKYNPGLKQNQFVSLSSQGVQLIEGLQHDLYKVLINHSYAEITGRDKKTRGRARAQ